MCLIKNLCPAVKIFVVDKHDPAINPTLPTVKHYTLEQTRTKIPADKIGSLAILILS